MPSQQVPAAELRQPRTPEQVFQSLERNRGRLQAVEYACFGLANGPGKDASCLTWILDDVLSDLDLLGNALEEMTVVPGAKTVIPIPDE